jgi:hypothetical protein
MIEMPEYLRKEASERSQRRWLMSVTLFFAFLCFGAVLLRNGYGSSECNKYRAPREIFRGITAGCQQLRASEEGAGSLYWMRIDLKAPGVELYVTPTDPVAIAQGWQYRLRSVRDVVLEEDLAVAVNACLFSSSLPWWWPWKHGAFANGVETVVADHVVSHDWEHTYLLWFDDVLKPNLRRSKPPTRSELRSAKWGVGGQAVWLWDGKVWPSSDRRPDARTAVAIDQERRLLFLAVARSISPRLILQKLAELGAKDGMLLDGGSSASMVVGEGARGLDARAILGGGQPVATQFGVRAQRFGTD